MFLSIVSCMLGSITLSPCEGDTAAVARAYSAYAGAIPARHLALVKSLYWTPNGRGESWYQTGRVGLPHRASLRFLAHEVGHLVSAAGSQALLRRYRNRFWPAGYPLDGVPSSYTRTNVYEDWAEAYAHVLMRQTGDMPERRAWLVRELPELNR